MNARDFAPFALRIGMALVVLWFGVSQVIDPSAWTGFLPSWLPSLGMTPQTHIIINGAVEIIVSLALLAGFWTRIAAIIAAVHMYAVTVAVGYSAVGVRDFGLFMGLVAVALYGADYLTFDAWRARKKSVL